MSPGILDQIERTGRQLGLGGVNRTVTVMFCDIRNFTPLSETMSANDLVTLLNGLFTELGGKILGTEGTIDKFIGDAIMAFWNAPVENKNHRRLAATAALQMRHALDGFNKAGTHKPIATAIGISSGIACVGNIGSKDRFNYSAIGDTVNVSARIEAACRHVDYDILLADGVADGVRDMAMLDAGELDLKGKSALTHTCILVGDAEVAAGPVFQELHGLYQQFIDELCQSGEMDMGLIAKCSKVGQTIEPGLVTFFERLPKRANDLHGLRPTPETAEA